MLYFLCVGCQMVGSAVADWEKEGVFQSNLEQMGVHRQAIEPILGLLRQNPDERWTLDELETWATTAERASSEVSRTCEERVMPPLRRFPFRDTVPAVIGARLPERWKFHGETIKNLGLMEKGVLVLLVVRNSGRWVKCFPYASGSGPGAAAYRDVFTGAVTTDLPPEGAAMEVVEGPNAVTPLRSEDWVYFGIQDPSMMSGLDARSQMLFISERLGIPPGKDDQEISSLARSGRREGLIHDFPEFDGFEFPEHCVNAVLGPSQFAMEGQNALNLRSKFGINLAGIAHADDTVNWWPGGGASSGGLVLPGDYGLIIRLPRWTADTDFVSAPTVPLDVMEQLLQPEKFRQHMDLTEDGAWGQWEQNAKRLVQKKGVGATRGCCAIS